MKYGLRMWYVGSSYDLTCTIDTIKILQEKGINNIKFVVMGDGPLKLKFENCAKNKGVYAKFTGRLDYGKMVGMLTTILQLILLLEEQHKV